MCEQGFLASGRNAITHFTNGAWTQVMFPKEDLVQEFTQHVAAMGLSSYEMVSLMFHALVGDGLLCDEERGGSTFVARR